VRGDSPNWVVHSHDFAFRHDAGREADTVIADTSVWVDHLRRSSPILSDRLSAADVWTHPYVIGELACGTLRDRARILAYLDDLPSAPIVDHREALAFLEMHRLAGMGIGWIDVHLLASAALARQQIWTLDRRLARAAQHVGVGAAI